MSRREVARAAGVSVTTVTHALNPPPGVRMSSATRERVRRVARELGYRPSFVGRALVSGRSFVAGLLQPAASTLLYPFYQEITLGLSEAMAPCEYHPLLLFRSAAKTYLRVLRQGRIDGMLVLQSERDCSCIEEVAAGGIPTVAVNVHCSLPSLPNLACVHSDHAGLLAALLAEFEDLGCRRLLFFHDYRRHDANASLHEHGEQMLSRLTSRGLRGTTLIPDAVAPREQCRRLFASGWDWDGVFVDGSAMAEMLIEEALRAGVEPGRDFTILVGETSAWRRPTAGPVRAVYCHQPRRIGEAAWALLDALMAGSVTEKDIHIPYRRLPESTGLEVVGTDGDASKTRRRGDDGTNHRLSQSPELAWTRCRCAGAEHGRARD